MITMSMHVLCVHQAVGEPPLFLASSVLFAIDDAVQAARVEAGIVDSFCLDSPATCERIRLACTDHLMNKVNSMCCCYKVL